MPLTDGSVPLIDESAPLIYGLIRMWECLYRAAMKLAIHKYTCCLCVHRLIRATRVSIIPMLPFGQLCISYIELVLLQEKL